MAGIPVQQFLLLRFWVRALRKCSAHSSEPFEIESLLAARRGQHAGAALTAWPLPSIPLVHACAHPGGWFPAALPFCDLLPDVQCLGADTRPAEGEVPQVSGSAQGQSAPGKRMAPYCIPISRLLWTLLLVLGLEYRQPFIQSSHTAGFKRMAWGVGVWWACGGALQRRCAAAPILEAQSGVGDFGEPSRVAGVLTVAERVGWASSWGQKRRWRDWVTPRSRKK